MMPAIGLAIAHVEDADLARRLLAIQNELFDLGADVATPGSIEGAQNHPVCVTRQRRAVIEDDVLVGIEVEQAEAGNVDPARGS